jgi:hypothetical protein
MPYAVVLSTASKPVYVLVHDSEPTHPQHWYETARVEQRSVATGCWTSGGSTSFARGLIGSVGVSTASVDDINSVREFGGTNYTRRGLLMRNLLIESLGVLATAQLGSRSNQRRGTGRHAKSYRIGQFPSAAEAQNDPGYHAVAGADAAHRRNRHGGKPADFLSSREQRTLPAEGEDKDLGSTLGEDIARGPFLVVLGPDRRTR